jgi:hypothetical protein
MNKSSFSRSVLRGAICSGVTAAAFASAAKLTPTQMKLIRAGERELTFRQKKAVSQLTGKSCGQLAALDIEPDGGSFTDLMNGWAEVIADRRTSPKPRARH